MTDTEPLILLIEDEPPVHKFLGASLPAHGFRLLGAETGKDGLARAADYNPDVVLLDLGLPDLDGLEVTRRLREWSNVPIIVLSARGQEKDKIAALDAGADDYLTKPFSTGELLARIRVAIRHTARLADNSPQPTFIVGDLRVDLAGRHVFVGDTEVHLTPNRVQAADRVSAIRRQGAHAPGTAQGSLGPAPHAGHALSPCPHGPASPQDRTGSRSAAIPAHRNRHRVSFRGSVTLARRHHYRIS